MDITTNSLCLSSQIGRRIVSHATGMRAHDRAHEKRSPRAFRHSEEASGSGLDASSGTPEPVDARPLVNKQLLANRFR